jgi:oligopeptide transport system substrate-binding protein
MRVFDSRLSPFLQEERKMSRIPRARIQVFSLVFSSLALMALFLTSCGVGADNGSRLALDQTFIWPLTHETSFNDLIVDPANTPDVYSAGVVNLIYGHLVTTDHDLNVIPDMASSWEISSDGLQYTFHLKPDLHFSDGNPLTANDFAYSIDRALDPQVCVPFSGPNCHPFNTSTLSVILGAGDRAAGRISTDIGVGIFAPDARTLQIKLAQPAAHFLGTMTGYGVSPVERTFLEKYGLDHKNHTDWTYHLNVGGGSGPFILQSYGDGKTLTFIPNPYWDGPKLTLKKLIRPIVSDLNDVYTGYRQGKYDYADVPPQEYLAAQDQNDFHEIGQLSVQFLGINQLSPPFDNLHVRLAFALALNKQLIADRVLNGASLPTNHIIPQGQPGFDADLTAPGGTTRSVTGDAEQAQTLIKGYFAQCGCSSLQVTLTYPDDAKRDPVAPLMIQMWETILSGTWGTVTVIPDKVPFATLVNKDLSATPGHPGPLQMWLVGLSASFPSPFVWMNSVFSPTAFLNAFNYRDDNNQLNAWALMQQADATVDQDKRLSLYAQAEQQLVNDALEIPYAQDKGVWRIKPYIQGFNPTASLAIPIPELEWAGVSVLAH